MIRKILLFFGIVLCATLMSGCIIWMPVSSGHPIFPELIKQEVVLLRELVVYNENGPDKPCGDKAFGWLPFYTVTYQPEGISKIITDYPILEKGYYVLPSGTKS